MSDILEIAQKLLLGRDDYRRASGPYRRPAKEEYEEYAVNTAALLAQAVIDLTAQVERLTQADADTESIGSQADPDICRILEGDR